MYNLVHINFGQMKATRAQFACTGSVVKSYPVEGYAARHTSVGVFVLSHIKKKKCCFEKSCSGSRVESAIVSPL